MPNIEKTLHLNNIVTKLRNHVHSKLKGLNSEIQSLAIAYSGGCDSHVLLDIVASLLDQIKINILVVHINHNISPHASMWQRHCNKVTNEMGLSIQSISVDIELGQGKSIEKQARESRYLAIFQALPSNTPLLLGHHADDQTETLLMRLFNGAGPAGLIAMQESCSIAGNLLLRPLLTISKDNICSYAKERKLCYIEDESNLDNRFDRNYIRNNLLPIIKQRWPQLDKSIIRTSQHCLEQQAFVTNMFNSSLISSTELELNELNKHIYFIQKTILRAWIAKHDGYPPSSNKLTHIFNNVINARNDAKPILKLLSHVLRRYKNTLYLVATNNYLYPENYSQSWLAHDKNAKLPCGTVLSKPIDIPFFHKNNLYITFRKGGERFHPVGRSGSHPVKKLMQEWLIPPWRRQYVPLIYYKNSIICITNFANSNMVSNSNNVTITSNTINTDKKTT